VVPAGGPCYPVVVLRFSDVQVWQWEDDYELFESPVAERGQVRALDYYAPTNVFSLLTLNTRLLFSARRLMVELQPWDTLRNDRCPEPSPE
jgi:hypothetical protein